jgi:prephenate dehydratase
LRIKILETARRIQEKQLKVAAIASVTASEMYDLEILAQNSDDKNK